MEYFTMFGIKDLADILCVALLMFYIYKMMRRTGSLNMFMGILIFIFIWMIVSQVLKMPLFGAILDKLVDVGVIALIVLFADDIRQFFRGLGKRTRTGRIYRWLFKHKIQDINTLWLQSVVLACSHMSAGKVGALIVIQKNTNLEDIIQIGEKINADINQLLIENIFFKNSPLHDGAMIIIDGRIRSAACVLPVSNSNDIPKHFGLRHRAALGITQNSDAIAVVVSEETGGISVFENGEYRVNITPVELAAFLKERK